MGSALSSLNSNVSHDNENIILHQTQVQQLQQLQLHDHHYHHSTIHRNNRNSIIASTNNNANNNNFNNSISGNTSILSSPTRSSINNNRPSSSLDHRAQEWKSEFLSMVEDHGDNILSDLMTFAST